MKKYELFLNLAIIDTETGETVETQEETEYFDTQEEAKQAAATYTRQGVIGEYGEGAEKAVVISAEVSEEPTERGEPLL